MTLEVLSRKYEHFETPEWAVKAILDKEILTQLVVDPRCGTGILSKAAKKNGHGIVAIDIHDWGFPGTLVENFLTINGLPEREFTVFMNPPFSKAVEFVEKSFALGASKIVCFQRFAWWESKGRKEFWEKYPPNRVYICGDRANCWRHDIPQEQRGSSTPTAHAWFVWERGNSAGTLLGHVYKDKNFIMLPH